MNFSEPQDSLEALERLPPYLDAAYHEVLQRIEKSKAKSTAIKALSWVFHAVRPLTIDELREAISIRPFRHTALQPKFLIREDLLVKYCQGLLVIDEIDDVGPSRTVRFTHHTVREFLAKAYMDKLLTHIDIAKVCLTYLTFDDFELGPCYDTYTLLRQIGKHRLWGYCVENWGAHTRGEAEQDPEVARGVYELLASTGARSSMYQLILSQHGSTKPSFVSSTPLRVLAEEGLATIYKQSETVGHGLADPKTIPQIDYLNPPHLVSATAADNDALLIAVRNGRYPMAAALLESGLDVNVRSRRTGESSLHIASKRGHVEVLKLLIRWGADLEARDKRLRTPLHLACKYGGREGVVYLLDVGATVSPQDQEGWTPLHFAVAHSHLDVKVLLDRGANVLAKDNRGFTPLEMAAKVADVSRFEALLKATIKHRPDPDISFDTLYNLTFHLRHRELQRQLALHFPESTRIS